MAHPPHRSHKFRSDIFVHLVELARGGRIALQEDLTQPDRSQRFGVCFHQASAVGRNNLRTASADIDHQHALAGLRPIGLHPQMNQPRLFPPGDDFHRRSYGLRRPRQKLPLVARIANRAGGHGAHAYHVQCAIQAGHPRKHRARRSQRLLADRAVVEPRHLAV